MEIKKKSCLTTREIEEVLKKAGIQPTAQRLAISKYVLCEMEHATVDEIKSWADDNFPKISLATVYNTVNTLVEYGLIKALKLPHSDKVLYDNNIDNHYHFFDEDTSELVDVYPAQVKIDFYLGEQFKVNGFDVLIKGKRS